VVKLIHRKNWLITFHLVTQSAYGTLFSQHSKPGEQYVQSTLDTESESCSCNSGVPFRCSRVNTHKSLFAEKNSKVITSRALVVVDLGVTMDKKLRFSSYVATCHYLL